MTARTAPDFEVMAKPPRGSLALRELPDFGGAASEERCPVLFVPGFLTSYAHSALLRKRLQESDYDVYNLSLPRFAAVSLARSARVLERKVEEICILRDVESLCLVCFGAGGLVARYFTEKMGGARFVKRAIMLGTPHRGSRVAYLAALLPAAGQIVPDADFLEDLNRSDGVALEVRSRYVNLCSAWDGMVVPHTGCMLAGSRNLKLAWRCPHAGLLWSKRVFKVVSDLLAEVQPRPEYGTAAARARDRFREISGLITDDQGEAAAFFARGALLLEHGYYSAAVRDFDRAISIRPDFTEALYMRAKALSCKLKYDENPVQCEAIRDFNQVIRAQPGHLQAYYQRGVCYALLGDWASAISCWDQVLIINRDYFPAYLARALGRLRKGDVEGARSDLREVLRLQPDNAEAGRMLNEL